MATIEIHLNSELFSADVVARTAHRYTNDYFAQVTPETRGYLVRLTPQSTSAGNTLLPHRFRNDTLDERLHEHVGSQTEGQQTPLIYAAMRDARPRLGSEDPVVFSDQMELDSNDYG